MNEPNFDAEDILGTSEPIPDTDRYSELESRIGVPLGSTAKALAEGRKPEIVSRVQNSAGKLAGEIKTISDRPADDMQGYTLETLENDKARIRTETFAMYNIAKKMMQALHQQIGDAINPSDKMWASAAKMIESISGTLKNLLDMTVKLRQEEELKQISLANKEAPAETGEIELGSDAISDFIEHCQKKFTDGEPKKISDESEKETK